MRLIDADAMKDRVKNYMSVFDKKDWRGICEMLNDAPTIEAEPIRYGEWLMDDESGDIKCSCCGHWSYDTYDEPFVIDGHKGIATIMPHYCGYCGAKMDEVSE